MYDYIIIGAGISGITFARLLQLSGNTNFIILEKGDEAGGLCRTKNVNNHILDLGGGHLLNSIYPEVYKFIFDHLPEDQFNKYERVSKIQLPEGIIDYPIEQSLYQLPDGGKEYLDSIKDATGVETKDYESYIYSRFGSKIAANYLKPYNRKIWGVEPHEMDVDWLNKIPKYDYKQIVECNQQKKNDKDAFPSHATFYYPKSGGFQSIFNSIWKHVRSFVKTNHKMRGISFGGTWVQVDEFRAKRVINTAPWQSLKQFLSDKPAVGVWDKIQNNSITVDLYEEEYTHPCHWIYYPDMSLSYHRKFFINNFAPYSAPNGMFTETNSKRAKAQTGIYRHVNEYGYPIPVIGHDSARKTMLEYYRKKNVFGLGRWGTHTYHNSDVCMKQAMDLFAELENDRSGNDSKTQRAN